MKKLSILLKQRMRILFISNYLYKYYFIGRIIMNKIKNFFNFLYIKFKRSNNIFINDYLKIKERKIKKQIDIKSYF